MEICSHMQDAIIVVALRQRRLNTKTYMSCGFYFFRETLLTSTPY